MKNNNNYYYKTRKDDKALAEFVNPLMLGQISQKSLFNFSLVFFPLSNEKTKPSQELMQLSLLNFHKN